MIISGGGGRAYMEQVSIFSLIRGRGLGGGAKTWTSTEYFILGYFLQ